MTCIFFRKEVPNLDIKVESLQTEHKNVQINSTPTLVCHDEFLPEQKRGELSTTFANNVSSGYSQPKNEPKDISKLPGNPKSGDLVPMSVPNLTGTFVSNYI